jgi:hypothetical protein
MSGHLVTGVGPALVMYGHPGVGSCRRGKPLFGCQVTGCAEREVGCGSQATGSKPAKQLNRKRESGHRASGLSLRSWRNFSRIGEDPEKFSAFLSRVA